VKTVAVVVVDYEEMRREEVNHNYSIS